MTGSDQIMRSKNQWHLQLHWIWVCQHGTLLFMSKSSFQGGQNQFAACITWLSFAYTKSIMQNSYILFSKYYKRMINTFILYLPKHEPRKFHYRTRCPGHPAPWHNPKHHDHQPIRKKTHMLRNANGIHHIINAFHRNKIHFISGPVLHRLCYQTPWTKHRVIQIHNSWWKTQTEKGELQKKLRWHSNTTASVCFLTQL